MLQYLLQCSNSCIKARTHVTIASALLYLDKPFSANVGHRFLWTESCSQGISCGRWVCTLHRYRRWEENKALPVRNLCDRSGIRACCKIVCALNMSGWSRRPVRMCHSGDGNERYLATEIANPSQGARKKLGCGCACVNTSQLRRKWFATKTQKRMVCANKQRDDWGCVSICKHPWMKVFFSPLQKMTGVDWWKPSIAKLTLLVTICYC